MRPSRKLLTLWHVRCKKLLPATCSLPSTGGGEWAGRTFIVWGLYAVRGEGRGRRWERTDAASCLLMCSNCHIIKLSTFSGHRACLRFLSWFLQEVIYCKYLNAHPVASFSFREGKEHLGTADILCCHGQHCVQLRTCELTLGLDSRFWPNSIFPVCACVCAPACYKREG